MAQPYSQNEGDDFHSIRIRRGYEVVPLVDVSVAARPSRSLDYMFTVNVEVDQLLAVGDVQLTHVETLSPSWLGEAIGQLTPCVSLCLQRSHTQS